ncbi:substrate import-associated zinc metallohydrolase lipoprotein [Chryseolinea serpens]|uniref:Substrate import-associated zinc metallohydrolase lipoprotein n=1 Tax=Chryseolinea serpens TaxID=947013 RepID=A0A1M5QUJ3_9BACT|nr:putative zinc-binding metallopeptidase [Chryseolinea serpens]SHH17628.1 substrate import-associated zinc metallohydrolase lipoprotein [Chryseolinea serpens]
MNARNTFRATIFGIAAMLLVSSCSDPEEDLDISFLDVDTETNAIDQWIVQNYTNPYNIAINYKWVPFELATDKTLVPVKEEKVIPVMTLVKETWIDPYVKEAGEDFMKINAPKQFVLVGSPQYNNDGTMVLGEAESGRKVTLFVINDFLKTDVPAVKQMLHTIHHEFAHILHQSKLYPRNFKQITPSGYTATWYNTEDEEAWNLGFITPYARASTDEDFVEMISTMLVEGHDGYEAKLGKASANGKALLRQKEAIVVAYFKETWNIDFYQLQETTTAAIVAATK